MQQDRTEDTAFPGHMPHAPPVWPSVVVLALAVYWAGTQWQLLSALSSFGIGNAIMLGLLARIPHWRNPMGLASITAASALVHGLAPNTWGVALLQGLSDGTGIAVGAWMLARLPRPTLEMRRERSPLAVLLACTAASISTLVWQIPMWWAAPFSDMASQALKEASLEFMNHVLIVPMVLSFVWPRNRRIHKIQDVLPLMTLLVAEMLASVVGGPGAIAFPLPAFIWCALRYPLCITSALFACFTVWKCHVFMAGHDSITSGYFTDTLSLRLGLSLLWLGPLTVACSHASRTEVLQRLHYASQHDHLTRTLSRATFLQRANAALQRLHQTPAAMAVVMLDIDHFKRINDQHGHAMGDTVLQGFATTVGRVLREKDLLGRYGGEEFCVCLPDVHWQQALTIAERLRAAVQAQPFPLSEKSILRITVSVGLVYYDSQVLPTSVEAGLSAADAQLYHAKTTGRNRVQAQHLSAMSIAPPPHQDPPYGQPQTDIPRTDTEATQPQDQTV